MPKTILVVDDEPNIVISLEFLMRKAGYGVRTACDGDQALDAIREQPPDLVLLDVSLPRKNGYEVCEAVRGEPAWADVRVVMLTARGRDVERQKGMAMGADDYVTKPFATRDLVEKVEALIGPPGD